MRGDRRIRPGAMTIYSGRECIGTIEQADGVFRAVATDGNVLGSFKTMREATAAFDIAEVAP
jgi:hypothetical protein